MALSRSPVLEAADLRVATPPPPTAAGGPSLEALGRSLQGRRDEAEREHILAILQHNGWNHSRAARELGISRTTLWTKIKRYNLEPPS